MSRSVAGAICTNPLATASRTVAGFWLTSTMRTCPRASTCDSFLGRRTVLVATMSAPRLLGLFGIDHGRALRDPVWRGRTLQVVIEPLENAPVVIDLIGFSRAL